MNGSQGLLPPPISKKHPSNHHESLLSSPARCHIWGNHENRRDQIPLRFPDGDVVINADPHERIDGSDKANGGQVSLNMADDVAGNPVRVAPPISPLGIQTRHETKGKDEETKDQIRRR